MAVHQSYSVNRCPLSSTINEADSRSSLPAVEQMEVCTFRRPEQIEREIQRCTTSPWISYLLFPGSNEPFKLNVYELTVAVVREYAAMTELTSDEPDVPAVDCRPIVNATIHDESVKVLFDSGSMMSMITESLRLYLTLPVFPLRIRRRLAGVNNELGVVSVSFTTVPITYLHADGSKFHDLVNCLIWPENQIRRSFGPQDLIIGQNHMNQLQLLPCLSCTSIHRLPTKCGDHSKTIPYISSIAHPFISVSVVDAPPQPAPILITSPTLPEYAPEIDLSDEGPSTTDLDPVQQGEKGALRVEYVDERRFLCMPCGVKLRIAHGELKDMELLEIGKMEKF